MKIQTTISSIVCTEELLRSDRKNEARELLPGAANFLINNEALHLNAAQLYVLNDVPGQDYV